MSSKKMIARQVVTQKSCHQMFQHLLQMSVKSKPEQCKKISKQQLEELAEMAAIVVNLAEEMASTTPVSREIMEEKFVQKWVQADPKITLELACALVDKTDSFRLRDIPCLAELIDNHVTEPNGDISMSMLSV